MRDDRLMNSLIKNYALESKDENGKASGHFYFDRNAAMAVSKEVLQNNMQFNAA